MSTYFLDEDRLDDVYLSEMLPSKIGWNNVFLEDEILRGYVYEMHDFMRCIAHDEEPVSNFQLAYDSIKIMYDENNPQEFYQEGNTLSKSGIIWYFVKILLLIGVIVLFFSLLRR